MSRTDKYREQHRDLEAVVSQIVPLLQEGTLAEDASQVRSLLSQLAGKLNVHLAMEDSALYPSLVKHPKPEVQAKAKAFIEEMGGIKHAFGGYLAHWPSAPAIQAAPKDFIKETSALAGALAKRIQSEDNDLYAMVDRLG